MPDAFISYRRIDKPFVRQLFDRLIENGRDVWIDWEDIPPTTDWLQEIYNGIESADNFIFIITPDSMTSEVCNLEVAHAISNNKRLVPILYKPVNDEAFERRIDQTHYAEQARDNWSALKHVNWIFFDDETQFDPSFETLLRALDTDIEYIKEHTRLLVKAKQWMAQGRNNSFLLRGDELKAAEDWLSHSANQDLDPTSLHTEFIIESRRHALFRQRQLFAFSAVGFVVMFFLALISFWQFNVARENESAANLNATQAFNSQRTAEFNAVVAQNAQREAETQLLQTRRTQSLFLASLAQQQLSAGRFQTALLLSISALQFYDQNVFNIESGTVLSDTLLTPVRDLADLEHTAIVNGAAWSSDEQKILSWTGSDALIWARDNSSVVTLTHDTLVAGGVWNPINANIVVTWAGNNAFVWEVGTGSVAYVLPHENAVGGALWHQDGNLILTWSADGGVRLWNIERLLNEAMAAIEGNTLEPQAIARHGAAVNGATWNTDQTRVLSWGEDGDVRVWTVADNMSNPVQRISLTGAPSSIVKARWSADESRVLIWNSDGLIRIYTPQSLLVFSVQAESLIKDILWHPSGDYVLIITDTVEAEIRRVRTNAVAFEVQHEGFIVGAIFNGDGSRLATWGQDGNVRVWDIPTTSGGLRTVLSPALNLEHDGDINGVMWNSDSSTLISWSDDDSVRFWDQVSGELLQLLPHSADVSGIAWTADDAFLLAVTNDLALDIGVIRVWDFRSSPDARIIQFADDLSGAVWSHNETMILAWGADAFVDIYSTDSQVQNLGVARSETPILSLEHGQPVEEAFWNRDDTRILAWANPARGCEGECLSEVVLWDVLSGTALQRFTFTEEVKFAQWSGDERYIAIVTEATDWLLVDTQTNTTQAGADDAEIDVLVWSADNTRLTTINEAGTIRLWVIGSLQLQTTFSHENALGAAWSPDNTRLLTWGRDDTARVWLAATGEAQLVMLHDSDVRDAHWSQDGTRILTGSNDARVRLWNAADGALIWEQGMPASVSSAVWNGDEQYILVVSSDSAFCARNCKFWVYVLDGPTGEVIYGWSHDASVSLARWSADERVVMTITSSGNVRLWDMANGEGRLAIRHDNDFPVVILQATLSQDDTRLLTAGRDHTLRVWVVDIPTLLNLAHERALRELTNEEREAFFLPTLTPSATPTATPSPNPLLLTVTPTTTATITTLPSLTPSPMLEGTALPSPTSVERQ